MTPGVTSDATRTEFINLLVTQLQNQDPLEPVRQEEYLGQLAQFSTLEGIEKLNANFDELLKLQQLTQGAGLIGHQVSFRSAIDGQLSEGAVDEVRVTDGLISLTVDGQRLGLDQIDALIG